MSGELRTRSPRRAAEAGDDATLSADARDVLAFLDAVSVPVCRSTVRLNVGLDSAAASAACHRLVALGLAETRGTAGRGYVITPRGEDYLAGNVPVDWS